MMVLNNQDREDHTPREKYSVRPRLEKYMIENGRRSVDMRCLMWFIGPMRIEKLFRVSVSGKAPEAENVPEHDKHTP